MHAFTQTPRDQPRAMHHIEIVEPDPADCDPGALPPEGNVKLSNYRLLSQNIRAYTPTGDINTSPSKGKMVARYDVCANISPPRARILELLRPDDPGRDALEAIVRPAPRRGLTRPLDEDTRRFLQRALQSPSPLLSAAATPEPYYRLPDPPDSSQSDEDSEPTESAEETSHKPKNPDAERSLAEELREAEEEELREAEEKELREAEEEELQEAEEAERAGVCARRRLLRGWGCARDAEERERLARLALSVEEDETEECALSATARRLDALLAQSRDLHSELADIHADLQESSVRARRCTVAARTLGAEARALRYLDDVVALLRGNVAAAGCARAWPFAIGRRQPGRNYII